MRSRKRRRRRVAAVYVQPLAQCYSNSPLWFGKDGEAKTSGNLPHLSGVRNCSEHFIPN